MPEWLPFSVGYTSAMAHRLTDLEPGTRVRVLSLGGDGSESDPVYINQILRLGLTPGTTFTMVRRAPLGDPIEIRLRGYSLALRPEEASALDVQVIE